MVPPVPYTRFHLLTVIFGAVGILFLTCLLAKQSDRRVRTVLLCVGLFLVLTELIKQMLVLHVHEGQYSWGNFPFQYCSVPMYLCLLAGALKDSPVRKAILTYLATYGLLGGLIVFTEPSGIFQPYWFLTLHSLAWHYLLAFTGVFLGASGMTGDEKSDFFGATAVFLVLSSVAFGFNLLFWGASHGEINNFFIGPAISPLAIYKTIATNYGWYINTPLFMLSVIIGAKLLFVAQQFWHRKYFVETEALHAASIHQEE